MPAANDALAIAKEWDTIVLGGNSMLFRQYHMFCDLKVKAYLRSIRIRWVKHSEMRIVLVS